MERKKHDFSETKDEITEICGQNINFVKLPKKKKKTKISLRLIEDVLENVEIGTKGWVIKTKSSITLYEILSHDINIY